MSENMSTYDAFYKHLCAHEPSVVLMVMNHHTEAHTTYTILFSVFSRKKDALWDYIAI